jgi:peptide methionine sulfoxide reductase msrA/msrB
MLKVVIVLALLALAVAAVSRVTRSGQQPQSASTQPASPGVTVRVFDDSGELTDPVTMPKVVRTDEVWQEILTSEQYRILRKAGTERAFTGALLEEKSEGVFACAGCRLPLFASGTKFKSGTGWPSFYDAIARENVGEHKDVSLGMTRAEILCARCDGHLGHVFGDGPAPPGQRYCVNSGSLVFVGADDLDELAETVPQRATVVIAGGCFWCVEAVFEELDGVIDAISGYAGGSKETANYKDVCSGTTDHAEAVQIVYDPSRISYEDLLLIHFATHDPTTLNRQGPDSGPQYRSAVFYTDEKEKALAEASLDAVREQGSFTEPIVTTVEPLVEFFPAEAYHQNYVCANPSQAYVRGVALPKVEKVRKLFKDRLKAQSPLER